MTLRKNHLGAAKQHGRRAITELRRMSADTALHWILSHKGRIAQFRDAVKGTGAEPAVTQLLALIRDEASPLPRRATPKRKPQRIQRRRRAARPNWIERMGTLPLVPM